MTAMTSAGTKIAVSLAPPATPDAAGYTALTFTVWGGVESIPAFGPSTAVNSFQPLDGVEEKYKGPANYGSLQIPYAHDKTDAGQTIIRTLSDPTNSTLASFMVTYPNGDKRYFGGRVFGAPEEVGSATNVIKATATVEISTKVVKADAV